MGITISRPVEPWADHDQDLFRHRTFQNRQILIPAAGADQYFDGTRRQAPCPIGIADGQARPGNRDGDGLALAGLDRDPGPGCQPPVGAADGADG